MMVFSAGDIGRWLDSLPGGGPPNEDKQFLANTMFQEGQQVGNPPGSDWKQFLAGFTLAAKLSRRLATYGKDGGQKESEKMNDTLAGMANGGN